MATFPTAVPAADAIKTLELLGFRLMYVRGAYIAMQRENADGSRTPLTLPNHPLIKGCTLKAIFSMDAR